MKIVFVRHAKFHVEDNKHFEACLSEDGIANTKKFLESGILEKPDYIFSSHFTTAVESARLIADYFKMNFTIKECLGEWKLQELNLPFEEYEKEENAAIKNLNFPVRGGESLDMAGERMYNCVKNICDRHKNAKNIIIVSHGNVLYHLFKRFANQKPKFNPTKEKIDFLDYGVVDYSNGNFKILKNIISKI